jgi:hypothetical protein
LQAAVKLRWNTRPVALAIAAVGVLAVPVSTAAAESGQPPPLPVVGGPPAAAPDSQPEPTPSAESAPSDGPAAEPEAEAPAPVPGPVETIHSVAPTVAVSASAPDLDGGSIGAGDGAVSEAVGSVRDSVAAVAADSEPVVREVEKSADVVVVDGVGVGEVVNRTRTGTGAALDRTMGQVEDTVGANPVGDLVEATAPVRDLAEATAPVRDLVEGSHPPSDHLGEAPGAEVPSDSGPSPTPTRSVDGIAPPTAPPVLTDVFAPEAGASPMSQLGDGALLHLAPPRPQLDARSTSSEGPTAPAQSPAGLSAALTIESRASGPVPESSGLPERPAPPLPTLPSSTTAVASPGFGQGSFAPIAALLALLALAAPAILRRLREAACSAAVPFVCALERPG